MNFQIEGKSITTGRFASFTGHARQKGSPFGSLAAGVGRVINQFVEKVSLQGLLKVAKNCSGKSYKISLKLLRKKNKKSNKTQCQHYKKLCKNRRVVQ